MSVPQFTGIKYSAVTRIYYRWNKNNLERFVTDRKRSEHWGWEKSDYQDMSNNSANWTRASLADVDELINKHNPNKARTNNALQRH